jgi:hypothetical protein
MEVILELEHPEMLEVVVIFIIPAVEVAVVEVLVDAEQKG